MPLQLYKIATVEVGSAGASTIDFQSIPSGYTDLMVYFSGRVNGTADTPYIQFNGDTGSNYTGKRLIGTGSAASSDNWTAAANSALLSGINGTGQTSNTFSSYLIYIPNYTANINKSISADGARENNATAGELGLSASLWSSTAAINRLTIKFYSGNSLVQYSTATLYGIL